MRTAVYSAATKEGVHDLRPVGLWPAAGTAPPKNSRVPGAWGCSRCGRVASDTSKAIDFAKIPCSRAPWEAVQATHMLEPLDEHWRCSLCWLTVRPQHAAQLGRQHCPVPELRVARAR